MKWGKSTVCLICGIVLSSCPLLAAHGASDATPELAIQSKLFFVDPGTLQANVAIKVTIDNSPRSVFLRFNVQGSDKDDFILADLFMHGMHVEKGRHSTCTKRFEVDASDYSRIVKWRLSDVEFMDVDVQWVVSSLLVRAIPDSEDPSIGTILFRGECHLAGEGKVPDRVIIQGLDKDGFELCHFMFDDYGCRSGDASSSRRGRWVTNENSVDFDAFKRLFRPKDFKDVPRIKNWRALPITLNENNMYGITTWDGEQP